MSFSVDSASFGNASITGSLLGTASWANSASQALTASFLPAGTYSITSSWATNALTASYVNQLNQNVVITGSLLVTGSSGTKIDTANNYIGVNSGLEIDFNSSTPSITGPGLIMDLSAFPYFNNPAAGGNAIIFDAGGLTITDVNSEIALIAYDVNSPDSVRLFGTASYALAAESANNFKATGTTILSGSLTFAAPTSPAFNGEIVRFGAGTLTTGQLYFLSSSGTWSLANANSTGSSTGMLGIAVGSSPTTNGLLIRGFAASSSYTYGTGSIIYMQTGSGLMTAGAPSSSNHVVRVLGYQTTLSNTIYFDPDKTWVTLA